MMDGNVVAKVKAANDAAAAAEAQSGSDYSVQMAQLQKELDDSKRIAQLESIKGQSELSIAKYDADKQLYDLKREQQKIELATNQYKIDAREAALKRQREADLQQKLVTDAAIRADKKDMQLVQSVVSIFATPVTSKSPSDEIIELPPMVVTAKRINPAIYIIGGVLVIGVLYFALRKKRGH